MARRGRGGSRGSRGTNRNLPAQQSQQRRDRQSPAPPDRLLQLIAEQWTGPIPPPEALEGIEHVVPGAATRIVDEAMRNGAHRREMERIVVTGNEQRSRRGQWMALVVSAMGFGSAITVATAAHTPVAGVGLAGGTLATLVSIFIYGSTQQRRERRQQAESVGGAGARR